MAQKNGKPPEPVRLVGQSPAAGEMPKLMDELSGIQRSHTKQTAYQTFDQMIFGRSLKPVTLPNGIVIGGGKVIPEVNFTLPVMQITEETMPEVRRNFREITANILERARKLGQKEIILELEHLPPLTENPQWGADVTADMKEIMDEFADEKGVKSALRVTVCDIRDLDKPPKMRSGEPMAKMLESFELCAKAGADILSIESTGGKEVTDTALQYADLDGLAFGLGVLGSTDMEHLWKNVVKICKDNNVVAGGDTACGFGNTAMQLAHQDVIPRVLAAVVRLMSVPRSLVAVEVGATGPLKDCGYENPLVKAATGVPISMEGKSSACAHSSPVGNLAAAVCDLLSNESTIHQKNLGGWNEEVSTEMLVHDVNLMNSGDEASDKVLRDRFIAADRYNDPQALVLDGEIMFEATKVMLEAGSDDYARTKALAKFACETLQEAIDDGRLDLPDKEKVYVPKLLEAATNLPSSWQDLEANSPDSMYSGMFDRTEYGLKEQ